jgi:aryl-alcohol dehydrogenase-like predicted oxidoreductase
VGEHAAVVAARRGADLTPARLALADSLAKFAADSGHSLLELAYSWLLSNPAVSTVIGGTTRPDQIRANAAAGEGWRLGPAELADVDRICRDARTRG